MNDLADAGKTNPNKVDFKSKKSLTPLEIRRKKFLTGLAQDEITVIIEAAR